MLGLNKIKATQQGYLLVEVMVAMVIILLGVLGIAKVQHTAKNANAQAIHRTVASTLSDNLIERIRSNPAGIDTYFPSDTAVVLDGSTTKPAETCVPGSLCNPTQLAAFDIWEWEQNLLGVLETASGNSTGGLVNPTVCLLRPVGGGDGIYHIAIVWHGRTPIENITIAENNNASTCGTGDSAYDESGNDNVYRRVHWQQVYFDV